MVKTIAKYFAIFIAFVIWDWISSAGTILLAQKSLWAVPVNTIVTGLWIFGIFMFLEGNKKIIVPLLLLSAATGTYFAILWT